MAFFNNVLSYYDAGPGDDSSDGDDDDDFPGALVTPRSHWHANAWVPCVCPPLFGSLA